MFLHSLWILIILCGPFQEELAERDTPVRATSIQTSPYLDIGLKEGRFSRVSPEDSGLNFHNTLDADHELARLYHSGFVVGGVAIGDANGDGRPDIFLAGTAQPSRLYLQVGDLKFKDATGESGMEDPSNPWSTGASWVDFDNDGDLDLYLCNYQSPNQLWINDGHGRFEERAADYGIAINDASLMSYFGDFDNDGWLDLYLLTNRFYHPDGWAREFELERGSNGNLEIEEKYKDYFKVVAKPDGSYRLAHKGREDYLFRNQLGGSFVDITQQANITGYGHGLSAVLWDYDQDNDLDIYVCNDFQDADCLYENLGNGKFKDVIKETFKHTSWFSMGADAGDINNDGRSDLFTVDMSATTHYLSKVMMGSMSTHAHFLDTAEPRQYMRNFLHINAGTPDASWHRSTKPKFFESAQLSGISSTNWSWAPVMRDFDSDGKLDLFVTNGHVRNFNNPDIISDPKSNQTFWELYRDEETMPQINATFRNKDGIHFESIAQQWGLDHLGISYAAAASDLDLDGDVDLVVMNAEEPVAIFRNDIGFENSLKVKLQGQKSNRDGIGAKVRLVSPLGTQYCEVSPQRGYLANHDPTLHFGLGPHSIVGSLSVEWPSGIIQVLENVPANQMVTITEASHADGWENTDEAPPLFQAVDGLGIAKRKELNFDDFAMQPLLPNKMSQLGPGLALGDLDQDGQEELYLSAPSGQKKSFYRLPEQRNVDREPFFFSKQLPGDAQIEELAPLFFDADGDGDLDVYVVSGGVESNDNPALLRDRLFINSEGRGLEPAELEALPDTRFSGGTVAAADYDRDGDLDLFVGGRVVPGSYPLSPQSMLLRNESKAKDRPRFIDATADDSSGLREPGLVTSGLWTDIDNDGWIDLLVSVEWGPIRVYRNQNGRLIESSEACGTSSHLGWWNGLAAGDFDRDGDMDYVATNFGENTKYHPSKEKPSRIYYGQFGENEEPSIIETKTTAECELPVRGKSCSQSAMPHLSDKFPTYHEFALAELSEIYTPGEIDSAQKFEVNELASCVLWNDGSGRFSFEPLPWTAQIAPAFGVVAFDANLDGFQDLFLAQNFFTPQRETGRMAGGLGALLLGNTSGKFEIQWPEQSGIAIPGDAKGVVVGDFNKDHKPDLAVAVNDQTPAFFYNRSHGDSPLVLELEGGQGNRRAIGARVQIWTEDGKVQILETAAGGGYLSQSTSQLHVGLGDQSIEKILVRWPDGEVTEYPIKETPGRSLTLRQNGD